MQESPLSQVEGASRAYGVDVPDLFHDLIQSIVSALEARDPRTAEHSLRVGDMVERTCLIMKLPPAQTTVIHMAAHVHDIGKIGIPDAVLLKNGTLTAEERRCVEDHARLGGDILGRCSSLAALADIVRHHHERWDGGGYPDGLSGVDIALGSRIIAVCDSIDAMMGKRSYRCRLTRQACMQEIFDNMGTMYDPAIALCVLRHWAFIVDPVNFDASSECAYEDARTLRCAVPMPLALS